MSKAITIKRGLDIKLKGSAEKMLGDAPRTTLCALKPTDFVGFTPKLAVKQGEEVLAGDALFFDKGQPEIVYPSPVSGEVVEIKRGAKRKILEVKILADQEIKYREFGALDVQSMNATEVREKLLKSGFWSLIRQRPFSISPNPAQSPKAIHISCFNSAPLAPDYDFIMEGKMDSFRAGIKALQTLAPVHLNLNGKTGFNKGFEGIEGVVYTSFNGPHPAGTIGVQVNKIDPINKGEAIWYLNPQDVARIGKLMETGRAESTRIVAVAGSEVKAPKYFEALVGVQISTLLHEGVAAGNLRYISGNPLTGTKIEEDGFLGYYDDLLTVLPEGDELGFFLTDGWLGTGMKKFSNSKSYFNWLMPKKTYRLDTNTNGELRAFVVTGEMEKVFPFDIYPMQLIKSIMINDIDAMEKLGVYEVDAEDFALCEFVNTSKIDIQNVVRDGMENLRKELF
jgi:Na+-transporting NADH:ubiquinone oxidoreductase subunit A